eukprot:SAG31_NODE_36019_length_317_cov_0.935780_1_plen_47_part_10
MQPYHLQMTVSKRTESAAFIGCATQADSAVCTCILLFCANCLAARSA